MQHFILFIKQQYFLICFTNIKYGYDGDPAHYNPVDTVLLQDSWKQISNDFSIYQFPDTKNLQQFIRMGLTIQNINGEFSSSKKGFYNVSGHAEYRNKTRNRKWDIEANGKLFFTGLNAGDFEAYVSLQRFTDKKAGYLQVGFENVNRTPSFIFNSRSSFYLLHTVQDFKKENSSHIFASFFVPAFKLRLAGNYYLLTNYTYLGGFYQLKQESSLFNILEVSAEKTFALTKHLVWRADIHFQKLIGNGPVNLPLIYTRNRIGYEGDLGFKNLDIAIGFEILYRSPYKADNYSPVLGRFFYQDSLRISNSVPDISAYLHFRIRPFKAFVRAENLNTARSLGGGFGFTRNNLVAPGYPYPGLQFRIGIYWSFVN